LFVWYRYFARMLQKRPGDFFARAGAMLNRDRARHNRDYSRPLAPAFFHPPRQS